MNKEQTYQELTEQEKQLIQMILIEFSDILPPGYCQDLCAKEFADSGRMKSAGNRDVLKSRL